MNWIIPFKGRRPTGTYEQNLLWNSGNVYVMDNHRAAAWCWANEIDPTANHALFHIDRHYDTLESQLTQWLTALPWGLKIPIEDYLAAEYITEIGTHARIIRWDNYLPIYIATVSGHVSPIFFSTHRDGDAPKSFCYDEIEPWDLLENMEFDVDNITVPAILNIDLDFFFCTQDEEVVPLFSDDYFDNFCDIVARLNRDGKLAVITIALTATDDLTGGWARVERMAARLCAKLGHNFELPL